ncbi:hypothetical protein THAOC_33087 [Thalassiosira oceanica]|uniref:Uncharacterized protein n=1 Tax=Thalassiosira oceanica TaxID=159749 RepID=K0R5V2_THAOC|nr:hypothetical protein THAOC_33087 [Thalassiosira oceanica]|eukprot:EJK48145.1 hypothetical protein THAOC_33087 [Thalassiosira oceanica]
MSPCLRHEARPENARAEPGPKRGRRSSRVVGGGGLISRASSRIRNRLARCHEEDAGTPAMSSAGEGGNAREDRAGGTTTQNDGDQATTTARVDRDPSPTGARPGRRGRDGHRDDEERGDLRSCDVEPCHAPTPRDILVQSQLGAPPSFGGDDDNSDGDSTISSKTNFRRRARVELDFSDPGVEVETPRRHGRAPSRRRPHHQRWSDARRIPGHFTGATRASDWGEVLSLSREDVEGLTEDEVTVYSSMSRESLGRYLQSRDEEIWSLLEYLDRKALELKRKDPVYQTNAGGQTEIKTAQYSATRKTIAKPVAQSADASKQADLNADCSLDAASKSVGESDSSEHYIGTIACVGLDASQSSQWQDGAIEFHGRIPLDTRKGLGNDKRSDDSTVSTTMIELDMPPSSSSDWEDLYQRCSQTNETSPHAANNDEQSKCLLEKDEMIRILHESVDQAKRQRVEMERRLAEMEAKTKDHAEMNDKVMELDNELLLNQWQKVKSMEKNTESRLTKCLVEISADLESYRDECASYREHILRKEREHAEVEQSLYEEKKKVLSLEAENQMLLNIADDKQDDTKSERVTKKELAACKEQCKGYQQQVLELERRVMSAEEALESASQKATALEQDKLILEEKIGNITADRTRLESSLVEMNTAMKCLEQNLASKASRQSELETQLAQTKKNAEISDNSACRFAKKNTELKKHNEELLSRHNDMLREVEDATALALSIDPLKKMIKDNEAYIARLHDDLSVARSNNLESLKKARTRYSAEIKDLSDRLRQEEEEKREVAIKNIELTNILTSPEQACFRADNTDSVLTSKEDQVDELTKQADELRRKHASSQENVIALRKELSESERAVQEMAERIDTLVREKSEVYETLTSVLELRESRQLELVEKVQNLRSNLKRAPPERDQTSVSGQQFADAMDDLRAEKTIIQADLESWDIGLSV